MPLTLVTIERTAHPEILTQPAASVLFPLSAEDQTLIAQMKIMLEKINGVGLAAPQIGAQKKILVFAISEEASAFRQDSTEIISPTVLLNARYSPAPDAKIVYDWEGCFSVEEKTGKVPRYNKIIYSAQHTDGTFIHATAQGFTARVLQHEIDHLEGILIVDRLSADCVQGHPNEMMALRFQEFSPKQKEIVKTMITKQESDPQSLETAKTKWLAKAKALLDEDKKQG